MTAIDYRMTRRSILIGAAASLICAPAIVRAASLMPVRGLPLQFLNPEGEFYRRCFYHSLDSDLRAGRSMSTVSNGKICAASAAGDPTHNDNFRSRSAPNGRACAGTRMASTLQSYNLGRSKVPLEPGFVVYGDGDLVIEQHGAALH
jgi:hypothetical protein